jgi:hypothetical protein
MAPRWILALLVSSASACAPVLTSTSASPQIVEPRYAISFVGQDGSHRSYVILEHDIDEQYSIGQPTLVHADQNQIAASRPIDVSRLSDETRVALRNSYSVRGWSDASCEASLGAPVELRLIDPQLVDGASGELELAEAWQREPYARVLAAPVQGRCDIEARWALPGSTMTSLHHGL